LTSGANVFLTGEPGSGKTHTVNRYVHYLKERNIEPAITASTGIAATHIGGMTIHSWSGIGIKNELSPYDLDRIGQNERLVKRMSKTRVLIIDEVSMLSAKTLGMIETVCRELRNTSSPFGGLQVVLVGDFFQLPPIVKERGGRDEEIIQYDIGLAEDSHNDFAFKSHAWSALNPLVCYLSEQHRQEDAKFLELLSAIRQKKISPSHREMLHERKSTHGNDFATKLFSHNVNVDRINESELQKLTTEGREYVMTSMGSTTLVESLKRGCLSPEVLRLKKNAKVMFTKNDISHQFVNGTLGVALGFEKESGYPLIKTKDGRTITATPLDWSIDDGGKILAKITQVPLRLAWAITIHKSQGMSLDAAHMDLSDAFEYGQGYVALSRVRTLQGLSLLGFNERSLAVHPHIFEKDGEFKSASEGASSAYAAMAPKEKEDMRLAFLRAIGGKEPSSSKKKETKKSAKSESESTAPKRSLDELRKKYPNAYRPWKEGDDAQLTELFEKDMSLENIAQAFGRQQGSITARLVKLGFIEDPYEKEKGKEEA